jgi:hypothetical protein
MVEKTKYNKNESWVFIGNRGYCQECENNIIKKLIKQYRSAICKVVSKYNINSMNIQDKIFLGEEVVWECWKKFKEKRKTKFLTYFYASLYNRLNAPTRKLKIGTDALYHSVPLNPITGKIFDSNDDNKPQYKEIYFGKSLIGLEPLVGGNKNYSNNYNYYFRDRSKLHSNINIEKIMKIVPKHQQGLIELLQNGYNMKQSIISMRNFYPHYNRTAYNKDIGKLRKVISKEINREIPVNNDVKLQVGNI